MGKGKLRKFEEMKTFPNVFQPDLDKVLNRDFRLKGKWNTAHFRNNNPLILELGCGKGEYTVGLAEQFPGQNYIGIDIKGARIWTGARRAQQERMLNAAFIRTRIEFITSFFAGSEVDEIWITFPDPQLKQRRSKKRLTGSRFLNSYRAFLKDGGVVHLKTDNAVLYEYTCELVKQNGLPCEFASADLYGEDLTDLVFGIRTYYEEKFIEEGKPIHYLKFRLPAGKEIVEPDYEPEGGWEAADEENKRPSRGK